jgi:hypothetical protein
VRIPHPHFWLDTKVHGLTYTTCEQVCFFCGDHRHRIWPVLVWATGRMPK